MPRSVAKRAKRSKSAKSMKLVWMKRREEQKKGNLSGYVHCGRKKSVECDENQKRDFIAVYIPESVISQNIKLNLNFDENDTDPLVDFKVEPLDRTREYHLKYEQNAIDNSFQDVKEEPDLTSEYELLIEDIDI